MTLLNEYLEPRKMHQVFNEDEVRHFLTPRDDVVYCYVAGGQPGEPLTEIFSFYNLSSSVLNHFTHRTLKVAYSYYNVSLTGRLKEGMKECLVRAKAMNFDVFNALDALENSEFLEELAFGVGDGELYYYLYNWRIRKILV